MGTTGRVAFKLKNGQVRGSLSSCDSMPEQAAKGMLRFLKQLSPEQLKDFAQRIDDIEVRLE